MHMNKKHLRGRAHVQMMIKRQKGVMHDGKTISYVMPVFFAEGKAISQLHVHSKK